MQRLSRLFFVAAVVSSLCLGAVGTTSAQSEVTLTVSVVDQDDAAVGDIDVDATWDGGETSETTASNGRAFVDVPEGEDVSIDVDDDEFVRNRPVVVEDATERDVTVRVAQKGSATVNVTDSDGEPLADATVEFRRDEDVVTDGETGDDGTFESGVLERGDYEVHAVKPGFYRESTEHRVAEDSQQSFELERGSVRLDVDVVDDHFDPPRTLEGARVELTDAEGTVADVRASGGSASVSIDVNNRYTMTVRKDGYAEESSTVTVGESDRSVEAATQRLPALTVQPENDRVVVGETTRVTVVNAYDEPVEGADVTTGGETVGETDADGEVVVTVDGEGEQEFRAATDDVESDPAVVEGIDPDGDDGTTEGTPTSTDTGAELVADGGGFGVVVAVLGLLGALLLATRD